MGEQVVFGGDVQQRVHQPAVAHIDLGRLDQPFADIGVPWHQAAHQHQRVDADLAEMVEVEAKAMADIANAAGRVGDELRAEISRLSAVAIESVVANTVTDSVRQDLIEGFISKVGASR